MRPKVAIVTPTYNGKEHVLQFLNSLQKQKYNNLLTIIVDDGSTDGTDGAIKKQYPNVKVLRGDGSLWWSGSTNLGVRYALKEQAKYILTVNNDVILSPGAIEALVEAAEENAGVIVGSMICDIKNPEKVWYFGGYFDARNGNLAHITGKRTEFKQIKKVEWQTGMGALIPVKAYDDIGFYDQKVFPQYFGDADFALRAKKAGYDLLVSPASVVFADLESSWLGRDNLALPLSFLAKALFSIRSQFNVITRFRFYRRHWKLRYLLRFYRYFWKVYAVPLIKVKIKKRIGR